MPTDSSNSPRVLLGRLIRIQSGLLILTAFLFSSGYAIPGLSLLLFTLVAEAMTARSIPWERGPADPYLIAFVVVFALSSLLSAYRYLALGSAILLVLSIYLSFGTVYRHLRRDGTLLRPLLSAWVAGGLVAAIWAIVLHCLSGEPAALPALGKNAVGTTLLLTSVFGLGLFVAEPSRWRYGAMLSTVASLVGVGLTYSRGAWLGAAVGIATFFVLTELRQAWRGLALLAFVVVLGTVVPTAERARLFESVFTIPSRAVNRNRMVIVDVSVAMFKDHPVLGTGLGTFSAAYPAYSPPDDPNHGPPPFAHNIFLNMAAEGGVLGLGAFIALIVFGLASGWRWYAASTGLETIVSATLLAALVGVIVHQMVDGTLISVHLGAGLWFLLAILAAKAHSSPVDPPW